MKSATNIRSTYRLQLEPGFTFDDAVRIAPYLAALGISHAYTSPVFEAVPGSRHGYDIVDPCRVREALGGTAGRARFVRSLRANGLGLVADIVPNHQAVQDNARWTDVLRHGTASRFFGFFDLGTSEESGGTDEKVILPVLAEPYGVELDAGALAIVVEHETAWVAYGRQRFPLATPSIEAIVDEGAGGAGPADDRLAALRAAAARVNGDRARLHLLLESQHYRLAWWRLSSDESPYRRFIDVNALVGIRMDRRHVFDATHALIAEWLLDGSVDGLRVDHIDGLADPAAYLVWLRERAPAQWLVVEKILAAGEHLPDWPVDGTTGYEFGALVTRALTSPEAEVPATVFYEEFTGSPGDFASVAEQARRDVLDRWLAGDTQRVARILYGLCQRDLRLRDYSLRDVTALVHELVAGLPVYRTYVARGNAGRCDTMVLTGVFERVRHRCPDLPGALITFAAGLMAGDAADEGREFVSRLQQLSTTVAAKAVEDTAFYRYSRYLPLNEVGADPARFSASPGAFHESVLAWQRRHPRGMRSTMTHDSKRGEDVRARLTVLPELWDTWTRHVRRWSARAEAYRTGGQPDRNFEYYLYQTLVGAWPLSRARAHVHAEKAAREAKVFTNWLAPAVEYEAAVHHFLDRLYDDELFVGELTAFVHSLHPADWTKSLAQLLLKLTIPGCPDLYQGSELWNLSLCDPDNRGPVDYEQRRALLAACDTLAAPAVLARMDEGLPKIWTIRHTLSLKARNADLGSGESRYQPLEVRGTRAAQVIAFLRGTSVAVAVPTRGVAAPWHDTAIALPPGAWTHVLSGEPVRGGVCLAESLFAGFPVALLERASA